MPTERPATNRPRSPALGNLALLAGALLLVFAAAEGVARLVWEPRMRPPRPPLPEEWRGLPTLQSIFELGKPNQYGIWAGVLHRTNSAGFRGPELPREKPPGVLRIAVVGDSFPMGWAVREEEAYPSVLEQRLREREPERRSEVLNLGLAGHDTVQAVERLHDVGLAFDPDLVVYGFTLNDLENEHYERSRIDLELDQLAPLQQTPLVLWRVLRPRYGALAEVLWAPLGTYVHELDHNYFDVPEVWEPVGAALERLAATTRERRICSAVLIHTQLHYLNRLHPYHRHYRALADAAEARGLPVIHSFEAFAGRKDRELWVRADDAHPGAEGHAILAEVLLRGLDALPERCWRPGVRRAVATPRRGASPSRAPPPPGARGSTAGSSAPARGRSAGPRPPRGRRGSARG